MKEYTIKHEYKKEIESLGNKIKEIENVLDESVYGHAHAKTKL